MKLFLLVKLIILREFLKKNKLRIDASLDYDFMGFDNNFAFIDKSIIRSNNLLSSFNNSFFYIDDILDQKLISRIEKTDNNVIVNNWKDEYANLFNSIILEKYLYSFFGIIIIIISNFTFIIITCTFIFNKIKEFGILEVIGFNKTLLNMMVLIFSIIQSLMSLLAGIVISYLFIYLNQEFNFIDQLFNNIFLIDISYKISSKNLFLIILFSLFSSLVSVVYPLRLLNKLNINDKINYIK